MTNGYTPTALVRYVIAADDSRTVVLSARSQKALAEARQDYREFTVREFDRRSRDARGE